MQNKILVILILGVTLLFGGCTPFHQTLTGDEKTFLPNKKEKIEIYFSNEDPKQSYNEIGYIIAAKGNTKQAAEFLKEKAAKMGADGLINFETFVVRRLIAIILFIPIYDDIHIASGVAIKYSQTSFKGEQK